LVWTNTQKTLSGKYVGKMKNGHFKNVQNENPNVLLEIMFLKNTIFMRIIFVTEMVTNIWFLFSFHFFQKNKKTARYKNPPKRYKNPPNLGEKLEIIPQLGGNFITFGGNFITHSHLEMCSLFNTTLENITPWYGQIHKKHFRKVCWENGKWTFLKMSKMKIPTYSWKSCF
jgi:hypothetical protein